jgi:two-component sensor histidine kinase
LALHELAANSLRYGALSQQAEESGHVVLEWKIDGDTAPASVLLHINWTERDGASDHSPPAAGFGRIVLERLTPQALDGEASLGFGQSGMNWYLVCPAANAIAKSQ